MFLIWTPGRVTVALVTTNGDPNKQYQSISVNDDLEKYLFELNERFFVLVSIHPVHFNQIEPLKEHQSRVCITNGTVAPSCGQLIQLQIKANRVSNTFVFDGFRTSSHVTIEGQSWQPALKGLANVSCL